LVQRIDLVEQDDSFLSMRMLPSAPKRNLKALGG